MITITSENVEQTIHIEEETAAIIWADEETVT